MIVRFLLVFLSMNASALDLPDPTDLQSVVAIERAQAGVLIDRDIIYQFPDRKSFFITTPFNGSGKTREEVFGDMVQSKRVEIGAEGEKERPWRGAAFAGDVLLFLDGIGLEIVAYSLKSNAFLSRHSIVWDTLRPPRDRGGEAGTPETAQFRAKFSKAMSKAHDTKFIGMSAVPEEWRESGDFEYFVSTRIAGFPLITLRCTRDDPSRCRVSRGCFVEGLKLQSSDNVVGVGVFESTKLIVVGDRGIHGAHVLKFDSCLSVRKVDEIKFPKRVFELSNIHADTAGRLWVTSIRPDDYNNATTFYWDIGKQLK